MTRTSCFNQNCWWCCQFHWCFLLDQITFILIFIWLLNLLSISFYHISNKIFTWVSNICCCCNYFYCCNCWYWEELPCPQSPWHKLSWCWQDGTGWHSLSAWLACPGRGWTSPSTSVTPTTSIMPAIRTLSLSHFIYFIYNFLFVTFLIFVLAAIR